MGMQKGYVEVEFKGKAHLLRFDFNAIADIEEYFGKGIGAIMDEERVGFSTVRALYWGGLKWKIKGLTIEKTGKMIQKKMIEDESNFKELMEPIVKGLQASGYMGKPNPEGEEEDDNEDTEDDEKN